MLKVLAIAGIVLGGLLLLLLIVLNIVLFVPFRYKIGGSNKETLYGYFLLTFFMSFLRIKIYYRDKMGYLSLRILGIKVLDKTIPELVELIENISDKFSKNKDKNPDPEVTDNNSSKGSDENDIQEPLNEEDTIPEEDSEEYEISLEEAEKYINNEDGSDDESILQKNISFLSSLKDLVLNIKKKWYNFKEFVNEKIKQWEKTKKIIKFYWKVLHCPSLKPTLELFKNIAVRFIKHIFPRKWKMKIVYGDEDPYLTGKVHGYICMARGFFGKDIDFTPVWDENIFEFEGFVAGRLQAYVILGIAFKVLTNKHLFRMIKLIRKGGKISGR